MGRSIDDTIYKRSISISIACTVFKFKKRTYTLSLKQLLDVTHVYTFKVIMLLNPTRTSDKFLSPSLHSLQRKSYHFIQTSISIKLIVGIVSNNSLRIIIFTKNSVCIFQFKLLQWLEIFKSFLKWKDPINRNYILLTRYPPKCRTWHVNVASRPTATDIFTIGSANSGWNVRTSGNKLENVKHFGFFFYLIVKDDCILYDDMRRFRSG